MTRNNNNPIQDVNSRVLDFFATYFPPIHCPCCLFIAGFVIWFAIGVTAVLVSPVAAADTKLNVLLIISDDMRPDLGCYGHSMVQSPNINSLARAGVRFDRAYCQYPLCNPSRTSLLTGRLPTTTGVLDNRTWFGTAHPDWITLPKHFQSHGYASLRTGKIFHGGIDDADAWTEGGEPRTFEGATMPNRSRADYAQSSDRAVVLDGDGQSHGDYKIADRAIGFLRKYRDKPFFLACGFNKPNTLCDRSVVTGVGDARETIRTWEIDGQKREALIYKPTKESNGKAPVVFAFHGHSGNMRRAAGMFR